MDTGTKVAAIASGVILVAIIAVLVSQNSQTSNVISSASSGFAQVLQVAVSPVTGGSNIGLPTFNSALYNGGGNTAGF